MWYASQVPEFSVPGLSAGLALMGVVFSTNEKGRGEMVSFPAYTIKDVAERRTGETQRSPLGNIPHLDNCWTRFLRPFTPVNSLCTRNDRQPPISAGDYSPTLKSLASSTSTSL
ncbi:hypothetical protein E2C01_057912 [Portunus trituberculatus]|uniref:Uncharacterized protein n=1 Tax=Portunus trituberculatus TaxID=210409 RepID=A0A5B7H1S7_PORTR|nr:hypothetical protein [Portunus trituberculatus]